MSIRDYISYINTTQIHRVAVVLFIVLLGVGMGVGFSVASTNARNASDADYNRRLAVFSQWQMDLTSHFTKASSLAASVASFVFSSALIPANMSAPLVDRRIAVNHEAFKRFCSQIIIPGVSSVALASGGVLSQTYPSSPSGIPAAVDMYNSPVYKHFFPTLMNKTGLVTGGPSRMATRPGYATFFFFPIHVSNVTSIDTFWGTSYVLLEIPLLVSSLNISTKMAQAGMDYTMWYTTVDNGTIPTVVAESSSAASNQVMAEGMRMELPISEPGRSSYLAMYPRGGPVPSTMPIGTAVTIVAATLLGSAAVILLIYSAVYAHFLYRHRRAPANHTDMFVAALALRGAQPIADRAPLVAVRMFNDFTAAVRKLAVANGCYPVCEVGDRCMYVAAKDPEDLMRLAQAAVLEISVQGAIPPPDMLSQTHTVSQSPRNHSISHISYARTATHISKVPTNQVDDDMTQSSFIGTATCHPSVACHSVTAASVYDAARDVYFFGSAAQLNKLCGALDMAKCGEVCWTEAFEERCPKLCRGAASAALTSHTVSENGAVVLHVASWWKESGDERDNEDPSTAMAVLSDAYVRRMTVIVSEGKAEAKERRRKDGGETRSGSSNKSNEATALTRTATLLHVAVISGDEKHALEVVRRIVCEEKGAVVSAHEATIVAAFNLLSAGGHHQVRAADAVMRLREALPSTHFACSIQHGKVGALIMDGLVMCTGDAVAQGRALLQAAVALSAPNHHQSSPSCSSPYGGYATSDSDVPTKLDSSSSKRRSEVGPGSGLCLLCCHSEVSSTYDCEAVDVATLGAGKPRIVYRLAYRRSGKATDDEWMYRLKDEEDQSPFAVVNAVFARIASHDLEEAARLWHAHGKADNGVPCFDVSSYAKAAVARHLKSSYSPVGAV